MTHGVRFKLPFALYNQRIAFLIRAPIVHRSGQLEGESHEYEVVDIRLKQLVQPQPLR